VAVLGRLSRNVKSPVRRVAHFLEALAPNSSAEGERPWFDAKSIIASNKFWLIVTVLLALVLYWPSLDNWFVGDDFIFLRAARFADPPRYIKEAFDFTGYDRHQSLIDFLRDTDIALPFLAFRPLYFISLEGMYLVFGENAAGYHAVSIIVHLANTCLVWLIASRLLKGKLGPHIAATIFALHPGYVIAIAWISDMATPLATSLALLSLLLFMKSTDGDPPHRGYYIGSVACYGTSMYFHLETISWIAAFVAFLFLMKPAYRNRALTPSSWATFWPYVAILDGTLLLQTWIVAHTPSHLSQFQFGTHMLGQFKALGAPALYPVTSRGPAAENAAVAVLVIMLVTLPFIAYRSRRRSTPPYAELFIILWFLASVVPLVSARSLVGELDRKLYAAGPALAMLFVVYGTALANLTPARLQRYVKTSAAVALVFALLGATMLARGNLAQFSTSAKEQQQFVGTLRDTYPSLREGSTLYVVGAPLRMVVLDGAHLVSSTQAFYGRVSAYAVTEEQAKVLVSEGLLDEGDQIFWYSPDAE
jgi:hypothetical protein